MDILTMQAEVSRNKLRRIAISCENCRLRKVKCQGPPAPCVPCKKQGIQCNFRDQARSRRPRNKEVRKESFDDSFGSRGLNHSIETSMEPEGYEEGEGIAIAGSLATDEEFIGTSAVGALLNDVQTQQGPQTAPHSPARSSGTLSLATLRTADAFVLPPKAEADELVALFFQRVHTIMPILDQAGFLSQYDELWTSNGSWDPLNLALVNLVLALGSQFHSIKAHDKSVGRFQARASRILAPFMLGSCSMRLVQAWLLMSLQYQTSAKPGGCWSTVGHAVRLAHALGLHLDAELEQNMVISPRQELRKRVWSACVIFDRMVAVTWGRPTVVGDTTASDKIPAMPSTLDDTRHPLSSPIDVESFNNLSQLYLIASTSYKMLYASDKQAAQGSADTRRASAILILEAQLDEWRSNLLPRLQFTSIFDNDAALLDSKTHEKRFLQLLYLNYTMLIYRPSVEAARRRYTPLEAPSAPSCMVQVTMTSASACMAACCELVELTTANYASGDKYAWWWYDATLLFTAACVLFAARTAPEHSWAFQASLFGTRESACLEKALHGLDQRRHKGGNIDVSYRVLRGMYDKITKNKDHPSQGQSNDPLPPFNIAEFGLKDEPSMPFDLSNLDFGAVLPSNVFGDSSQSQLFSPRDMLFGGGGNDMSDMSSIQAFLDSLGEPGGYGSGMMWQQ